jgi:hypothetical protein
MFPIIDRDWVRALLATDIAFASDVTIGDDPDHDGGAAWCFDLEGTKKGTKPDRAANRRRRRVRAGRPPSRTDPAIWGMLAARTEL